MGQLHKKKIMILFAIHSFDDREIHGSHAQEALLQKIYFNMH